MGEMKLNHGITRTFKSLKVKDVKELRDRICVGDILRCPRMVKDSNGDLTEKWGKVAATEKYPHLVTVIGPGPKYPIRTITYLDILTDSRFTENL